MRKLQCLSSKLSSSKFLATPTLAATAITVILATAGCGILYRQPIYQGNLIDKSAADQLQVGMSMQQVQGLLGAPSIADPFHQERWDYTASERVGRTGDTQVKNFTVYFDNGAVSKWEGDYFPEQDEALAQRMGRYGNLAKDKDKKKGR